MVGMLEKRVIKFNSKNEENKGLKNLHITKSRFSYIGDDKYIITKDQCLFFTSMGIKYSVLK